MTKNIGSLWHLVFVAGDFVLAGLIVALISVAFWVFG